MRDLDPSQYSEADRREVDPPVEVESATWSAGGQLDWWVKERQQWLGRYAVQTAAISGSKLLIFVRLKRASGMSAGVERQRGLVSASRNGVDVSTTDVATA
jgi:hypothetical protein